MARNVNLSGPKRAADGNRSDDQTAEFHVTDIMAARHKKRIISSGPLPCVDVSTQDQGNRVPGLNSSLAAKAARMRDVDQTMTATQSGSIKLGTFDHADKRKSSNMFLPPTGRSR